MINFGTNYLVVNIRNELNPLTNGIDSHLILKVAGGINKGQEYNYDNKNNQIVKFGRKKMEGINVVFQDEATSRFQCTYEVEMFKIILNLEFFMRIQIGLL